MKKKITKLCILAIMLIAGVASKAAGSSAYCGYLFDPSSGGNANATTNDAVNISWYTMANGEVVITMDNYGTNPYALFRNFNLGSLKVNGTPSSNYFTLSYNGLTAVPAPTNQTYYKQVILTPKSAIPDNASLVFSGVLEYMTANVAPDLDNLWPTATFTYTYGTSCPVPQVAPTPQSINFTPTQGVKTFSLTGANLTSNLTLTASKGLIVSPTTIPFETDGTIAAANQIVTVTWDSGSSSGGYINISGGGIALSRNLNVTSSGFSDYCNTVISQENDGASNMAYLTVTTNSENKQVLLSIAPYDTSTGATASFNSLGSIDVSTTISPKPTSTITYNSDKTMATLTFSSALLNGDVVTFGGALTWTLQGTLWNNTNCFINATKTYTVGLGCDVAHADNTPPDVVSASNVSSTSYNAIIAVNATDYNGVTNIHFVDAVHGINITQLAKSGNGIANYTISNLQGNTNYSFVVTALDLAGNETAVGDAKTVAFTTLRTPQITATPGSLDFTPTTGSKTFTLSGAYVTDVIQLSVPAGYTVTPSTFTPIDGTIAATTVTVNWINGNGLGNKIGVSGGGLQNPVKLIDLTYSGGFSDYCSYVITQSGGADLTTPAILNIGLNNDNTILTYKIAPFDITGDATWNGNSLTASVIKLNGVAVNPTRTQVDSHTITITFSQPLVNGDVISYTPGTTLVWTTTGYTNYGNNGNCYIDGWSKTYTVGQNCNLSFNVITNTNVSDFTCLNCNVLVNSGVLLNIDESKTFKNITVAPGGKITNSTGQTLTANILNLNSDATGTATYVDNGTTNVTSATVQQYLTPGRNWYFSSPVSGATGNVVLGTTGNSLWQYNEPNSNWTTDVATTSTPLTVMKGFVAQTLGGNLNFTGTLNSGNLSITLNKTVNSNPERGYNLVGNPYPSYVNWDNATKSNLEYTLWYRTQNKHSTYVFDTYGALSHVGTNNNEIADVTANIPPMQAFWVKIADNYTTGTLAFDNSNRSHNDVSTNLLRAPSSVKSVQPVLRLQVSNGTNSDETIVLFNPNATNGYDAYDSPKMSNANAAIPEIYTTVGDEKLVINGLNSITLNTEIPLGFSTGQSNAFTIKATEISNFDADAKIILKDNLLNTEQDLTANATYSFSSDVTSTAGRFSLIFKSTSVNTGLNQENSDKNILIYKNPNNRITIECSENLGANSSVVVTNAIGQKIVSQQLTNSVTVLDSYMRSGIYMVTVTNAGKTSTQKVILN